MNHSPTKEQSAILDFKPLQGATAMVDAVAGSGKTSTVEMYANAHPTTPFLYLCFNRAQADEAKSKFPPNTTCQTTHSLAFSQTGRAFTRNKAKPFGREPRAKTIMGPLAIEDVATAHATVRTLTNYLQSAQIQLNYNHLPIYARAWKSEERECVLRKGEELWRRMIDPQDAQIPISHDGYLKKWQEEILRTGQLPWIFNRYRGVLVDEAQDTNPAFEIILWQLIKAGRHTVILVGDERQSIYQWRGAVNMMSRLRASLERGEIRGERKTLTESFRYGPRTAEIASHILSIGTEEKRQVHIVGRGTDDPRGAGTCCFLARTNAGLIDRALSELQGSPRAQVHFAATKEPDWSPAYAYKFEFIRSVFGHYSETPELITDPEIRQFSDWSEILEHAKKEDDNDDDELIDQELATAVRFVEKYQFSVLQVLEQLESRCGPPTSADVSFSTAHRAKGLEWDFVTLLEDFPKLSLDTDDDDHPDREELNLLYVAATRPRRWLNLNSNLTQFFDQKETTAVAPVDIEEEDEGGDEEDDEAFCCQGCHEIFGDFYSDTEEEVIESDDRPGYCTDCAAEFP